MSDSHGELVDHSGREHIDSNAPLFAGSTELHGLCRAFDWAATPLGPVAGWPASLRAAVRLCLAAPQTAAVWAGPELTLVYNDGYTPLLGAGRHPWALGKPAREVWARLWAWLGPEHDRVTVAGEAVMHEDLRVVIERNGSNRRPSSPTRSRRFTPKTGGSSAPSTSRRRRRSI